MCAGGDPRRSTGGGVNRFKVRDRRWCRQDLGDGHLKRKIMQGRKKGVRISKEIDEGGGEMDERRV